MIIKSLKSDFDFIIDLINNEFHKLFNNKQLEEFAILEEAMKKVLEDPKQNLNMNLIPYTDQDIKYIQKNLRIINLKKRENVTFEINKVMQTIQKLNTRLKEAEVHINKLKKNQNKKITETSIHEEIKDSK